MGGKGVKTELIRSWNEVAKHLVEAEKAWVLHQKLASEMGRIEIEKLPVRAQRLVSASFGNCSLRCKFDVLIPRLIEYTRRSGGLGTLVVSPPTVEEIKERAKKRAQEKKKGDLKNG